MWGPIGSTFAGTNQCCVNKIDGSSSRKDRNWSIECRRTTPQIEMSICACRTTTQQFFWQQQHVCGALGVSPMECGAGQQPHKTLHFHSRHGCRPSWNDPPKKSLGLAYLPPHRCWTLLLLEQMGYGLLCDLWVWRKRTNLHHVVLHCPIPEPPHGLLGLKVLEDETTEWLLISCPEI